MKQINETKIRVKRLIFNYTFTDLKYVLYFHLNPKRFSFTEKG